MRVLLISALPPPSGGIATWTEYYINYFNKKQTPLYVVNTALCGRRASNINYKTTVKDEFLRTKRIFVDYISHLHAFKPSIVHVNTPCCYLGFYRDFLCVLLARIKNIPVIIHFHCDTSSMVKGIIKKFVFNIMCQYAEKILVLNKRSYDFIKSKYQNKTTIVPNFIDESFVVNTHTIRNTIEKAIYVGHTYRDKGIFELIETAACFPDIEFSVVGPISKELEACQLTNNVKLLGVLSHEAVRSYLLDSDIFVFPSYAEGFSLSLTEAMACGLPAVASDVGANMDMLENKGGLIVPAKNSMSIVSSIKQMYSPLRRKEMSDWEIRKIKDSYTTNIVLDSLQEIYTSIQ
jgi:glycosyltransferase involved in cell wall biosynthesis